MHSRFQGKVIISTVLLSSILGATNLSFARESAQEHTNFVATNNYYQKLLSNLTRDKTELQIFLRAMPKGADLHHHYSGAIYAETYLNWVGAKNYCVYRENDAQHPQQKFRIEINPANLPEPSKGNCVSADAVRKDANFYRQVLVQWSTMDFYNHTHLQVSPDQHFFNTFDYFSPVSKEYYNEGFKQLKAQAIAENVQYIETMLTSAPDLEQADLAKRINALTGDDKEEAERLATFQAYFDYLKQAPEASDKLNAYLKSFEGMIDGINDDKFTLRFQTYVSRNKAPSRIFSGLYMAFSAAKANPNIVAVNLVGPENGVIAMRDYRLHMQMLGFLKAQFPQVHLSLHAGELALGLVPPNGLLSHVNDAVTIAKAERIGHAADLAFEKNPHDLLRKMKQDNIAVEINLTSNDFILGIKGNQHPISLLRKYQVPFVISTDDAGVSRNELSNEYLRYASDYQANYAELKNTVFNSLRYSFLSNTEKQTQLKELENRFQAFEQSISKLSKEQGKISGGKVREN